MTALTIPDLLEPKAAVRVDVEQTRFAVAMAFAGSTSGGLFAESLARATVPRSTWDAAGFADDLFLRAFVARAFQPGGAEGQACVDASYIYRVLSSPPTSRATIDFRRAILEELATTPRLRASLHLLHTALGQLRGRLENTAAARSWDANRQRLETLAAIKGVIDVMATGFEGAASGLARVAAFGASIAGGEAYRSLTDLLAYDAQAATLDLKVVVGADGRIRELGVVAAEHARDNPFSTSPVRRWLARLELFVRGYRLGEHEVMARLVDAVFAGVEEHVVPLVQLTGDVEVLLGAMAFRDRALAAGLHVCMPKIVERDAPRELRGLFNPLLLSSGVVPTPCDMAFGPTVTATLITGPNSGGKTRLLQAVGLSQVLAQCGMWVPARSGTIALASGLVASLIEGTSIDQAEGRLGTEMIRIRSLFERLPPHAMVLLDELCSGTNPSEGERIVELVLGALHRLGPQAFITTHFLSFAHRLASSDLVPGLDFMQVELDAQRRPTYRFRPGVAETSLAEATAERLGVTREQLHQLVERSLAGPAASAPAPEPTTCLPS